MWISNYNWVDWIDIGDLQLREKNLKEQNPKWYLMVLKSEIDNKLLSKKLSSPEREILHNYLLTVKKKIEDKWKDKHKVLVWSNKQHAHLSNTVVKSREWYNDKWKLDNKQLSQKDFDEKWRQDKLILDLDTDQTIKQKMPVVKSKDWYNDKWKVNHNQMTQKDFDIKYNEPTNRQNLLEKSLNNLSLDKPELREIQELYRWYWELLKKDASIDNAKVFHTQIIKTQWIVEKKLESMLKIKDWWIIKRLAFIIWNATIYMIAWATSSLVRHEGSHMDAAKMQWHEAYYARNVNWKKYTLWGIFKLEAGTFLSWTKWLAWHKHNNYHEYDRTPIAAAWINSNTEIAGDAYMNMIGGDWTMVNSWDYMVNKLRGLLYTIGAQNEYKSSNDPTNYIKALNAKGITTNIKELEKWQSLSLLSGGVISSIVWWVDYLMKGESNFWQTSLKIWWKKIFMPEFNSWMNPDWIWFEWKLPIKWNDRTLVVPSIEKSVSWNWDDVFWLEVKRKLWMWEINFDINSKSYTSVAYKREFWRGGKNWFFSIKWFQWGRLWRPDEHLWDKWLIASVNYSS